MSVPDTLKLGVIKQIYPASQIPNIPEVLADEFARLELASKIKSGDKVVITSGSRGIDSMLEVISELVKILKSLGAKPFILPAMGSHGGGTDSGQVEVLEHLGQTEHSLGAPILADYRPTIIGEVFGGLPVSVDGSALREGGADHVILVGRVKEHTEFIGPIESGLLKMAVVGLGRVQGATKMHQAAVKYTYHKTIEAMAKVIFSKAPILCGVALVEDQRNNLCHLEVVSADQIFSRERELLILSQSKKPHLPWDRLDVLIVDEMGKDISGAGLDTKVIGRIMNIYEQEPQTPKITRLISLKISAKGGGNAIGVGLNDFITRELFEAIDPEMTDLNSTVAVSPEKGRIPIVRANAKAALEGALATVGPYEPEDLEMAFIASTKDLEYLGVSAALWRKSDSPEFERIAPPRPLPFKSDGNLMGFKQWLESLGIN
ncbi:MAG: hypothetical protein LBT62_01190 [Deltaproteobacteria bacterium]|jgi:hypothetical protein|nr:hypothetical protein [Deltaproteobacteria bacterium]